MARAGADRLRTLVRCAGLILLTLLAACGQPQPLRIGFIGGLSGRVADMGVSGRNGALLAVEQANAAGGVNGRSVELIVRDDAQRVDMAQRAVSDLLAARVPVIIGPMTSVMAEVVLPLTQASGTVLISPTVTSTALSGRDDHFFRVCATTREYATASAEYVLRGLGVRRVAAILDMGNEAFTSDWLKHFEQALVAGGGSLVGVERYQSVANVSLQEPVARLLATAPQAVLVAAGAVDMARISQLVRRTDSRVVLVGTTWAATEELVSIGGRAVEGAILPQVMDRDDDSAAYAAFVTAYRERFGHSPGFAAVAAYDATRLGLEGLARTSDVKKLRRLFIDHRFTGVQQVLHLDAFGDTQRDVTMTVIRNGRFQRLAPAGAARDPSGAAS